MGTVVAFTASKRSVRDPELDAIAASLRERFGLDEVVILGRRKADSEANCSGGDDGRLVGPVLAVSGDCSVTFWEKFVRSVHSILRAISAAEVAHAYGLEEPRALFQNRLFDGIVQLFGVYDNETFNQHIRQHNALAETLLSSSRFATEHHLLSGLRNRDRYLGDDGETSFPS